MKFRALEPPVLQQKCPASSSIDRWRYEPDAASRLDGYRSRCCVNGSVAEVPRHLYSLGEYNVSSLANGTSPATSLLPTEPSCDMSTSWAWHCVERACREDFLANVTVSVEGNASEYGRCERCNAEKTICSETHLTTIRMGIIPGFWRSNELSMDVRRCFPRSACTGANSSRSTLAEQICRRGHHGPFCASCMDNHFKNVQKLCEECSSAHAQLIVSLLPVLVLLGVIVGLSFLTCLRRVVRTADPWKVRERLDAWEQCFRRALQFLFGPISVRAVGLVIVVKGKIVWSMLQVQLGVISAFAIEFPEDLMGE